MTTVDSRPDCYKCIFRGNIPGSAHSRCRHPSVPKESDNPLAEMMALFASVGRLDPIIDKSSILLGIKARESGIRRGWFNWPYNFDPVWLLECNGYTEKKDGK